MKISIIGASFTSLNFARRIKELNDKVSITIFEKNETVKPLDLLTSFYLENDFSFEDENKMLLIKLENWYDIKILFNHEVLSIDSKEQTLLVSKKRQNENGQEIKLEEKISYETLILASGLSSKKENYENIDKVKNYFIIDNIDDLNRLKEFLTIKRKILLVGSDTNSLSICNHLIDNGHMVSMVTKYDQVLHNDLSYEMSGYIESEIEANGIFLYLKSQIVKFDNLGKKAFLNDKKEISFDALVLVPEKEFNVPYLKNSKIKISKQNRIFINQNQKTSLKNIYALGSICEYKTFNSKINSVTESKTFNLKRAISLANFLSGINEKPVEFIRTNISHFKNIESGSIGFKESFLKQNKINYEIIRIHETKLPNYFEEFANYHLKIIFNPKNKNVLGAQIITSSGASKFIDILQTLMRSNNDITLLKDMNYLTSLKDNYFKNALYKIGTSAFDITSKLEFRKSFTSKEEIIKENGTILDVRDENELRNFEIEGAINIPLPSLRERINEIKNIKMPIYILCKIGKRAKLAQNILRANELQSYIIDGGELTLKIFKYKNNKFKGE